MAKNFLGIRVSPRGFFIGLVGVVMVALTGIWYNASRLPEEEFVSPLAVIIEEPGLEEEEESPATLAGLPEEFEYEEEFSADTVEGVLPAVTADMIYTVQVASFQEKERAEKAAADLKNNGITALIKEKDLAEQGVWYRVEVGAFTGRDDAVPVLENVRQYFADSFIKVRD